MKVYVISDDVNGGHGGGIESESLGGLKTQRDFANMKDSKDGNVIYKELPIFHNVSTKSGSLELADMIPDELVEGIVLHENTPLDLLDITIAQEVLGVDYVQNSKAKAVVLGIKTYDRAYNHTKAACDRFTGGSILGIDTTYIRGYQFLRFQMLTDNNKLEHAIAFVVGDDKVSNTYNLQTNWLIGEYIKEDEMYNFQVWANRPDYTDILVGKIIDKLEGAKPVVVIQTSDVPDAYVISGTRELENLRLKVNNRTDITNGMIRFEERKNEMADIENIEIPLQLNENGEAEFMIPLLDGYEYQGYLYLNGELVDEVYLADGDWGFEIDQTYTVLNSFKTENVPNRVYHEDEYPMYRNVSISAKTSDFVTVYKSIKPATHEADLTEYKSLRFYAKGQGKMEIKLTKGSIVEWNNQYSFSFDLDEDGREYIINLNDFVSPEFGQTFTAEDLRMIVFTVTENDNNEVNLNIDEVAFSKQDAESLLGLDSKGMDVAPNPNDGNFSLTFMSSTDQKMTIKAFDVLGKEWMSKEIDVIFGQNIVPVELPSNAKGLVIISLGNDEFKYESQKVIVK